MKKTVKQLMSIFLAASISVGGYTGVWASNTEAFTDSVVFSDGNTQTELVRADPVQASAQTSDYMLNIDRDTIHFEERDFYDPEFRVQKAIRVTNIGKKSTKITLDTSELKYFQVDDQFPWDDMEPQDTKKTLKTGDLLWFYIIPKEEYGTYDETFWLCTDDGSRYPVHITMEREKYAPMIQVSPENFKFEEETVKYKKPPKPHTVTVKNIYNERVSLKVSTSNSNFTADLSKTELEPKETAEIKVQPIMGLENDTHYFRVSVAAESKDGKKTDVHDSYMEFHVNERLFCGAKPPEPIKKVRNGVPKTAEGLHLPDSVEVYDYNHELRWTGVDWKIDECSYNPNDKNEQTFIVEGELIFDWIKNYDDLNSSVSVEVQVDKYQALAAPVLGSVRKITNYVEAVLWDFVDEADGYQYVTVRNKEALKVGKFTAVIETDELKTYVKYIPAGTNYLYCRAYKNVDSKRTYGEWSEGKKLEITDETPNAPKIEKTTVKNCDIRIKVSTPEKVAGYDVVLARDKKGTEPVDYAVVKKGCPGNTETVTIYGVPEGIYYVGVHSYKNTNPKILSKWSKLIKVVVKKGAPDIPPVIKTVKKTGKDITAEVSVPKYSQGADWVLAKNCYSYQIGENQKGYKPSNYVYSQKNKTTGKVTFKALKPGTYYLMGRAYVNGYKKNFSAWSKPRKIVIK